MADKKVKNYKKLKIEYHE